MSWSFFYIYKSLELKTDLNWINKSTTLLSTFGKLKYVRGVVALIQ